MTHTRQRAIRWLFFGPVRHPEVVLKVLERAADDIHFFGLLSENPALALKEYALTSEERVALATVDVGKLECLIGRRLDQRLVDMVIIPLLSRERW